MKKGKREEREGRRKRVVEEGFGAYALRTLRESWDGNSEEVEKYN